MIKWLFEGHDRLLLPQIAERTCRFEQILVIACATLVVYEAIKAILQ